MNPTLESLIVEVRGQKVIVDEDLANLYGVETKVFNQAIKRNKIRFPEEFAFQLSNAEFNNLKSQIVTSSLEHGENAQEIGFWGGRRKLPWVFTEHGVLMAATVLKSDQAVQMSLFLVRAFVRLREQMSANHAILTRLLEIDKQLMQHDGSLRDLYRKLMPLLNPETEKAPDKGRLGFQKDGAKT